MPEHATNEVLPADSREHPAALAWGELQLGRVRRGPSEVHTLRLKRKSAVYRLGGAGPGGSAVIAKRCPRATARLEYAVYAEVLPHLPVSALRCYGLVEEDGQSGWLFLEDAGGEEYSPHLGGQRALAGRWLGLLHTAAARVLAAARLPDRGPGYYLEHLRSARDTIGRNRTNPALGAGDRAVLRALLTHCDAVEARWEQVREDCDRMPRTLVHGDFVVKNVHVRPGWEGLALLPFDWEVAGWGVPAPDLVQALFLDRVASVSPDLTAYRAV